MGASMGLILLPPRPLEISKGATIKITIPNRVEVVTKPRQSFGCGYVGAIQLIQAGIPALLRRSSGGELHTAHLGAAMGAG
jgi:hypothetical protein